jgi:hypothetical protein
MNTSTVNAISRRSAPSTLTMNKQDDLSLDSELILPVRLRVELSGDDKSRFIEIKCHYYCVGDRSLDYYEVIAGRLIRTATYNNVLSCVEI